MQIGNLPWFLVILWVLWQGGLLNRDVQRSSCLTILHNKEIKCKKGTGYECINVLNVACFSALTWKEWLQWVELYPAAPEVFQMHSLISHAPEAEKILSCLSFKHHTPIFFVARLLKIFLSVVAKAMNSLRGKIQGNKSLLRSVVKQWLQTQHQVLYIFVPSSYLLNKCF